MINNNNESSKKDDHQKNYDSLKEELYKLKEKYDILIKETTLFAYEGDVTDNQDYIVMQERKEILQKEISKKEQQLLNFKNNKKEKRQITYLLLKTKEEKTVWLTNEWDSDPSQNYISYESPLGKILADEPIGSIKRVCCIAGNNYEIKILNKK